MRIKDIIFEYAQEVIAGDMDNVHIFDYRLNFRLKM